MTESIRAQAGYCEGFGGAFIPEVLHATFEELKTAFVEHSAGGGAVTVKASGSLEITDITIKPEAIDPDDPEMLQDLLVSAVNGAITAAQALQQQKMMGQLGGLGGLGIPGL